MCFSLLLMMLLTFFLFLIINNCLLLKKMCFVLNFNKIFLVRLFSLIFPLAQKIYCQSWVFYSALIFFFANFFLMSCFSVSVFFTLSSLWKSNFILKKKYVWLFLTLHQAITTDSKTCFSDFVLFVLLFGFLTISLDFFHFFNFHAILNLKT